MQGKTTLLVSLLWMVFNMIPSYLLLHYTFIGKGTTLKIMARRGPCLVLHFRPCSEGGCLLSC